VIGTLQSLTHSANASQELRLEKEVVYVDEEEPCSFCRDWWESEEIKPGLRKLKKFKGYTVDMPLKQLRNVNWGKSVKIISFDSPKGQMLLKQMHEEMLKAANIRS